MLTMQNVNETGFLNKNREWNKKENIDIWRRSWSVSINKYLRQNKKSDYVTHLSFLKQRELLIEKAKKELEKNNLDGAEKYLNAYNDFKDKKPRKRKPRHTYLNRKNHKNKLKNYNQQLEDIKKKKEDMKKENKLTSFFKNVFNKLTNKQNKEIEERRRREIDAINEWKKNEEKREELRERLKNENLNNGDINYENKIQNEPRRDQDYNIPTHKYKI